LISYHFLSFSYFAHFSFLSLLLPLLSLSENIRIYLWPVNCESKKRHSESSTFPSVYLHFQLLCLLVLAHLPFFNFSPTTLLSFLLSSYHFSLYFLPYLFSYHPLSLFFKLPIFLPRSLMRFLFIPIFVPSSLFFSRILTNQTQIIKNKLFVT
jgi:hypothetical protein